MTAETAETRANPTAANLAKIDAWMQRLADETDHAAQSAELTRYLQTVSRFYTYSAHNCMLIALQRPDAARRRLPRLAGARPAGQEGREGYSDLVPRPDQRQDRRGRRRRDRPQIPHGVRVRSG